MTHACNVSDLPQRQQVAPSIFMLVLQHISPAPMGNYRVSAAECADFLADFADHNVHNLDVRPVIRASAVHSFVYLRLGGHPAGDKQLYDDILRVGEVNVLSADFCGFPDEVHFNFPDLCRAGEGVGVSPYEYGEVRQQFPLIHGQFKHHISAVVQEVNADALFGSHHQKGKGVFAVAYFREQRVVSVRSAVNDCIVGVVKREDREEVLLILRQVIPETALFQDIWQLWAILARLE